MLKITLIIRIRCFLNTGKIYIKRINVGFRFNFTHFVISLLYSCGGINLFYLQVPGSLIKVSHLLYYNGRILIQLKVLFRDIDLRFIKVIPCYINQKPSCQTYVYCKYKNPCSRSITLNRFALRLH